MAGRDEVPDSKAIVRIVGLIILAFIAYLDSKPGVDINFFVYCITGGAILGVSDVSKLLSGISFNGNKKD